MRNIGRLALWSIPYVLGAAAFTWLGFWIAAHDFFNLLSQEHRRAIYVGAENRPKSPLRIETPNKGCIKITKVDLDGATASVYFKNECALQSSKYLKIHWQLVSPNGALLASKWSYSEILHGPESLAAGETAEIVFSGYDAISTDDRAAAIRFWVEE